MASASRTRARRRRPGGNEMSAPKELIDARHLHLNSIAEAEPVPRVPAHQGMLGWVELILIPWDFGRCDESFDEIFGQFNRAAVSPDADNNCLERVAEMLFHQEHFLPF